MRVRTVIVVGWMLATIGGLSFAQEVDVSGTSATGTYAFLACKGDCSFDHPANAFASGFVVLARAPLNADDIKRLDPYRMTMPGERLRACKSQRQLRKTESFVQGSDSSVSEWSLKDGLLQFSMMRTVDAGYEVELRRDGDYWSGRGVSWGAGVAAPHYSPDRIVLKRLGDADVNRCYSADS